MDLSRFLPRLARWLAIAGLPEEWSLFLMQVAIFIPLVLLAAIIDFKRKEF